MSGPLPFTCLELDDAPSVSIRILSDLGSTPLMVTSLKVNEDVSGFTQVAVAAQTLPPGGAATGKHYCNLVAIGRPRPSK